MKKILFALVALMGLSSFVVQATDFSGCEAEVNGWGPCVGEITVTPEAMVVELRQDGEANLWTGFVDAPPWDFGCDPSWFSFAFHSDVNGWGDDGTWHPVHWLPMTAFGNNYPAKGYFEAVAHCSDGSTHPMPFNTAYWVVRDVTGAQPQVDPESGLWIFGDYRKPSIQVLDGNTVRLDFGTNVVFGVADAQGLVVPMDTRNISSCGFKQWTPEARYTEGYVYINEENVVIAEIHNFPFGDYGQLVCKGPGEGVLYLAVESSAGDIIWETPSGIRFNPEGNYAITAPQ